MNYFNQFYDFAVNGPKHAGNAYTVYYVCNSNNINNELKSTVNTYYPNIIFFWKLDNCNTLSDISKFLTNKYYNIYNIDTEYGTFYYAITKQIRDFRLTKNHNNVAIYIETNFPENGIYFRFYFNYTEPTLDVHTFNFYPKIKNYNPCTKQFDFNIPLIENSEIIENNNSYCVSLQNEDSVVSSNKEEIDIFSFKINKIN